MGMKPNVGDTVVVSGMMDDPDPLPVGSRGRVLLVTEFDTTHFKVTGDWENGRSLDLCENDPFHTA